MNLADYLILAVIAQLFWLTRKVTKANTVINTLRSRCPFLSPEEKEEHDSNR